MKLLITGADGQLGRCLKDRLVETGIESVACTRSELDITQPGVIMQVIADTSPDFLINAAAYTAVDNAEDDVETACAVNALGTQYLAEACAKNKIPMLHVSTDYVFNGTGTEPYLPTDATSPIGVYGQSKLDGELQARSVLSSLVILRTAWVYSEYGNNFVKTMLRLAETRDEINVVQDQIGCPTYAGNIADSILSIARAVEAGAGSWGVYHYVDSSVMSWYDFAKQIFSLAKELGMIDREMRVNPIPSSAYPTKAQRPAYSVLDTNSLDRDYGIRSLEVKTSLKYVLQRINKEKSV